MRSRPSDSLFFKPAGLSKAAASEKAWRCSFRLLRKAWPSRSAATSKRWRGCANRRSARGRTRASCCKARCRSAMLRVKLRNSRRSKSSVWAISSVRTGNGKLGRGGGRGRADVGGEIDQRGIGFVAHRRDEGDLAFGDGADNDFLVEGHQIFDRAAAARNDQEIGPRQTALAEMFRSREWPRRSRPPRVRPARPPATAARGAENARPAGA